MTRAALSRAFLGTSSGPRIARSGRPSLKTIAAGSAAILVAAWGFPLKAADVDITANSGSVNLDAFVGTTVRIWPNVTVSGGVSATTQAWTVTNDGTVNGGNTVTLNEGGTFLNASGATVTGSLTAMTFGHNPPGPPPPAGGPGYLDNYGTIAGAVEGVTMWLGGTVVNHQGGVITTTGSANAVSIGQGTSRTVINSGEIHADRTTGFSTGILVQGGPSTITNTATGIVTGGYNGVYASATTPLTFTNHGAISSVRGPAIEATAGGTFVNTGTIGATNSHGFLIRDNADADITNSGTISGVVNAISFANTGGTAFAAVHTLRLQTGSVLNGNALGGANTDNLILNGTGTESIAKFLNFETLSMQGTTWSLTGTGTFATSSTIQSGVLQVNGQLTSPTVTVQNGGTLGGTGTIIGAVNNSGTIAPGNSIGTINITGPYTQAAGSTYAVELNTTASDLVNIAGTAAIQATTGVNVLAAPGLYTVGQRYTILTASGGVTGTYSTLTDNAPFVDFALFYDPNNVYLDVTRASVSFASIAQTPNQAAAATAAERLGPGNAVFNALIMLDTANALRAFDLLSGEIHATIRSILTDDSRFIRDGIFGRLRQFAGSIRPAFGPQVASSYAEDEDDGTLAYAARKRTRIKHAIPAPLVTKAPPPAPRAWTVWGHAFGNWGKADGDGNAATASHRTGGMIAGVDTTLGGAFGPTARAGLAGGYQNHSVKVADRASSADIDTVHLAAYAAAQSGPFALRLGAARSWHAIDTSRSVVFPGFSDTTKANYDGHTTQVFGELGYALAYGNVAVEPYAQLAHVRMKSDGFGETGGTAALSGFGAGASTTFSTLGLRAAAPLPGWSNVAMRGALGWRHAFNAGTPATQFAFSGGSPFSIAGVALGRDALVIEAGLDALLAHNTVVGLAYGGQYAGGNTDHALKGQAIRRF